MKNSIFFLFILLFFSACTPKIPLQVLHSPKVHNQSIKQLTVMNFKNDTVGQASSIETLLSKVAFKNKPYFTLVQKDDLELILNEKKLNDSALVDIDNLDDFKGLSQVKTFLIGEVLQSTMYQKSYFVSERAYGHCLKYNNDNRCIRFPRRLKHCRTNDYMVKTQIKAVEVISSDILFAQTYTQTDSISQCNGTSILPSKSEHNNYLATLIAKKVLKDLAPYYKTLKVALLKKLDISLSKTQQQKFKNTLTLLKQAQYEKAKKSFEALNAQIEEKSYVILYNLALSYESLNQFKQANKLYLQAKRYIPNDEIVEEISQGVMRTQKRIQEEKNINY